MDIIRLSTQTCSNPSNVLWNFAKGIEFFDRTNAFVQELIHCCKSTYYLHDLIENEHIHILEVILLQENTISINKSNAQGNTALHLAILKKSVKMTTMLLALGADPTIKNKDQQTPFTLAYQLDLIDILDLIFTIASPLVDTQISEQPIIHSAILKNHLKLIELLLKHKVNLNIQDRYGRLPIDLVQASGHIEAFKLLVQYDPKLRNYIDLKKITSLHQAVISRQIYTTRLLLQKGANIDVQDSKGNTLLHLAVILNNIEMVKDLLIHKANICITNQYLQTPLHLAVQKSHCEILDLFLTRYPKLANMQDTKGNSLLHLACDQRNLPMVETLFLKGAYLYLENKKGINPLQAVVLENDFAFANLILTKKAYIDAKNENKQILLEMHLSWANYMNQPAIRQRFLEEYAASTVNALQPILKH